MKSARLAACALVLIAACGLVSCQRQRPPDDAEHASAPNAKPGVSVRDGVLVLPAVKGNPGAAYFTVANTSQTQATLATVTIDGVGRTEMHESMAGGMTPITSLAVPANQSVTFARGGRHVMLFDVAPKLQAGGQTEMTLTFAGGDKVSAQLAVQGVNGAAPAQKAHS